MWVALCLCHVPPHCVRVTKSLPSTALEDDTELAVVVQWMGERLCDSCIVRVQ